MREATARYNINQEREVEKKYFSKDLYLIHFSISHPSSPPPLRPSLPSLLTLDMFFKCSDLIPIITMIIVMITSLQLILYVFNPSTHLNFICVFNTFNRQFLSSQFVTPLVEEVKIEMRMNKIKALIEGGC